MGINFTMIWLQYSYTRRSLCCEYGTESSIEMHKSNDLVTMNLHRRLSVVSSCNFHFLDTTYMSSLPVCLDCLRRPFTIRMRSLARACRCPFTLKWLEIRASVHGSPFMTRKGIQSLLLHAFRLVNGSKLLSNNYY